MGEGAACAEVAARIVVDGDDDEHPSVQIALDAVDHRRAPRERQVEHVGAPPWPEIYRTDAERHQSPDEARRTYDAVVDAYTGNGYHLTELPLVPPPERLRFVLAHT